MTFTTNLAPIKQLLITNYIKKQQTSSTWITPLNHEASYYPMKYSTIVVTTPSKFREIFAGPGSMIPVQLDAYSTHALKKKGFLDFSEYISKYNSSQPVPVDSREAYSTSE